jgi:Tat protein translocase TatB subunit
MGNLGFGELLMVFAVALVIFGPRKLPEIGRTIGKALGEFRRATNDLKNTLEEEVRVEEVRTSLNSIRDTATAGIPPVASTVSRAPAGAAIHRETPAAVPPSETPAVAAPSDEPERAAPTE